jgi:hypothetical protein
MTNAPGNTPILHHYDTSPFAEKVRLMLGFKGLDWLSVKVPQTMMTRSPRRDLGEMGAAMAASSSDCDGEVNVR